MTMLPARDLTPGMSLIGEDGAPLKIHGVKPTTAFRMSLEGHAQKFALWVDLPKGEWVLLHPDERVETA